MVLNQNVFNIFFFYFFKWDTYFQNTWFHVDLNFTENMHLWGFSIKLEYKRLFILVQYWTSFRQVLPGTQICNFSFTRPQMSNKSRARYSNISPVVHIQRCLRGRSIWPSTDVLDRRGSGLTTIIQTRFNSHSDVACQLDNTSLYFYWCNEGSLLFKGQLPFEV